MIRVKVYINKPKISDDCIDRYNDGMNGGYIQRIINYSRFGIFIVKLVKLNRLYDKG